jgi:Polyketide cyclase / dehydrase and lipid transport
VTIPPHREMITGLHEGYKGARRMINLISSTLIERPVQQVFDFISTPENDFHWQYGTLATARLSKGSDAMRTFFRSIGHLMGRRNLSTFEITEFEPNEKYGFKSLSGPVHSRTSYTLKKVNDRTRINISIQANAPNFFHITEKLLWKTMKKQLEEDVARLKAILEENSTAFRDKPSDIQS